MNTLLTIKEAALFLHVSEMSLRRWTNAGKLKCYRVGGKNERRFTRQDLESFLRTAKGRVPLGVGGGTVEDASHIAHFYKDAAESVAEGIQYAACGLSRDESILIVSTDDRSALILSGLSDLGFPVDRLKRNGRIVTDNGRIDLNDQLQFLASTMANFPADKGSRLLGDMIWTVEKGWSLEEITMLEAEANRYMTGSNKLILCQYDLSCFGADGAMMALDSHNLTIYRGEVKQSPYFTGQSS